MAAKTIQFENIQGNIFGGFNKDHQTFLFLRFKNADKARAWITQIAGEISTSKQVLQFNSQFKELLAEGFKKPEEFFFATWVNLAFTFKGLQTLNLKAVELDKFPPAFKQGMAARKTEIGDVGKSDPSNWVTPFKAKDLHAVLLVAADRPADLDDKIKDITGDPSFQAGVEVLQPAVVGQARTDNPGHEHFGFKDGVSQPGIRGVNVPDDPISNPVQGHPGQDLLWPGEFVLGYPTQRNKHKEGFDGPNPDPGPVSKSGPAWTADGSYLVFRRLAQDVAAFNEQVQSLATKLGHHPDWVGAKLVGRYKSGCPIERTKFQPDSFVPSEQDPAAPGKTTALAHSDALNNDFEFGDDPQGLNCPLAAHIRKAYPRNEHTPPASEVNSESVTQTHRLLRRGIAFGESLGASTNGGPNDPRGLLFLDYQNDIEEHFEFVQSQWVNNPKFPGAPTGRHPGQDPIIAQSPTGKFELVAKDGAQNLDIKHFVTTTGGEYFFAPSIFVLKGIGAGKPVAGGD